MVDCCSGVVGGMIAGTVVTSSVAFICWDKAAYISMGAAILINCVCGQARVVPVDGLDACQRNDVIQFTEVVSQLEASEFQT